MKKYFILATAAAVALASCSKVEKDVAPDQEISFVAANYTPGTKAETQQSGYDPFYSNGSFSVWAYFTPGTWDATYASKALYMDDVAITHASGTDHVWKASDTYYWPKAGNLSFIAYYPTSAVASVIANNADDLKIGFTDYTVNETLTLQEVSDATMDNPNDLMVSNFNKNQSSNTSDNIKYDHEGVSLLFSHILSKVQIWAKVATVPAGMNLAAEINSVEIKSIYKNGDFNGTTWDDNTTASHTTKTTTSGPFVTNEKKESGAISAAKTLTTTPSQQGPDYFVMPQTLPDDAVLVVTYTVYSYDNDNNIVMANKVETPVEVKLSELKKSDDTSITKWVENHVYKYTITIDCFANEIYFDPAEAKWDTTTTDADKEIK